MTPERWSRLREVFGAALDKPGPERSRFLDSACEGDAELRAEVVRLLAGNQEPSWPSPTATILRVTVEPVPGDTFSHYRIIEKLGRGGMGAVYKAQDLKLGRGVALKFLSEELTVHPMALKRFEREARAASALNHQNICTIHDFDEDSGKQFIVMEYIDGKALDQLIPQGGLGIAETLNYAVQIADALAKAHAAGIVHRDLKPANVMVTADGQVKVLDFGVAKVTAPTGAENGTLTYQDSTETGAIVGTTPYMSPEQAEGKSVDTRSDIFSFGTVLYEMLTGQKAFRGGSKASTLAALLTQDPKPLSETVSGVPEDFERLVGRCLRKDRQQRFQNAADLKVALLEVKNGFDSGSPVAPRVTRHYYVQRLVWGGAWAFIGAAVLAVIGWLVATRSTRKQADFIVKPITTYEGHAGSPTFSPDGSQVAFAWTGETQDNNDIYVKLVDSGAPLRLTTNPADDDCPAWQPDGRNIAFLRDAGDAVSLMLISPIGGVERKLAELRPGVNFYWWSPPAWTPDSKFLAVRDDTAIVLVSVEDGEKRQLTSPPNGWAGDYWPAISPDGRTLAFARIRNGPTSDIFVAPVSNGSRARRLTQDNREIGGLAWTPDGKEIVFASGRASDSTLWRISASGGTPERLPVVGPDVSGPAIARQGGRAAFVRDSERSSIWRLDLVPDGVRHAPVRLISSTAGDGSPMASPDGTRIAFASNRSGGLEVWVCDSHGADAVQLTSMGFARDPYWSPDGRNIVFEGRPGASNLLFVIAATGGRPRQLAEEGFKPSWSRDGHWIYYFARYNGKVQTWKIPSEGGKPIQVTKAGGGPGIESVDGQYFYYHMAGSSELWRVPANGGEEAVVMKENPNSMNLWAIGPRGLYFTHAREHQTILKLFRFETGRSDVVASWDHLDDPLGLRLSLPTDGRWLLYDQVDRMESNIMLIENFH